MVDLLAESPFDEPQFALEEKAPPKHVPASQDMARMDRKGLRRHLQRWLSQERQCGVLFVSITGIDAAIQLYGYRVGELALCRVADRVSAITPGDSVVGAWGETDLLVLAPSGLAGDLLALGERVMTTFDSDTIVGRVHLPLTASIGIMPATPGTSPDRLVHQASLALPPFPAHGVRHYSSDIEVARRRKLHLRRDIRNAGDRGELEVVYQPQMCMAMNRVVGAEALLRWRHPDFGYISPEVFIRLAEESGDILHVGEWVFREVAEQVVRWESQASLGTDFSVAVNAAPRQLCRPDFAERFQAILADAGVSPSRIGVEVTESGVMMQVDQAKAQLSLLREAGIDVAIDDFGTGTSSLAYLMQLPATTIKIDRLFVSAIHETGGTVAGGELVDMVLRLAHGIGRTVVVEGVETRIQHEYLRRRGCEVAQGYLYARPLSAEALLSWYQNSAGTVIEHA